MWWVIVGLELFRGCYRAGLGLNWLRGHALEAIQQAGRSAVSASFCKAAPLCILVDPSGCPVLLAVQYCLHWGLSCTLSRAIMVMGLFLVPSKPPVQVGSCSKV